MRDVSFCFFYIIAQSSINNREKLSTSLITRSTTIVLNKLQIQSQSKIGKIFKGEQILIFKLCFL